MGPPPPKEITEFSFRTAYNPGLTADVPGMIEGNAISAEVPFGTDVEALVATFEIEGESVMANSKPQVSGVTANDFSEDVIYSVKAEDSTTRAYRVTVTIGPSPRKAITEFRFLRANNPGLVSDVTADIDNEKLSIAAEVPFGTDVTKLIATFKMSGASAQVAGVEQGSDKTPNDFSMPLEYKVTAPDKSSQVYKVAVTIALDTAKEITSFSFQSAENPELAANIIATIDGTKIEATVPFDTDVSQLIATFETTGASVKVDAAAQVSGETRNDFSAAVAYTVTAADSSTKVYTVTVTVAESSAKAITSFKFLSANNNPQLLADVAATIAGTAITAEVPFGTDVKALVATFSHTGIGIEIGEVAQVSDITENDFTSGVAYTVTAADGSSRIYRVTVTASPAPESDRTDAAR